MFTSLLRRIIDVRLVPFATILLLSGCALHHPDDASLGAPSPASEEPVLPHIELPDFDIPIPDVTVPEIELGEPAPPPITSWVTDAPSFTLTSTSERASIAATEVLRETSLAFERLFGERPSHIAVAVIDTSNQRAAFDSAEVPEDVTSIVMVGGGLTGPDSTAVAAALMTELRFEAATAWLFDFMQTCAELQTRDKEPMPIAAPVAQHVLQREGDAAQTIARGPAGSALLPLVTPRDAEWRHGPVPAAEGTSLMTFLCNRPS